MDLPVVAVPTLPIKGSAERYPVHRIYCVGQNYADHAREMGSDPERQPPFFFTKPADAVAESGATIPFPSRTSDLHHEVELVVALGGGGKNVAAADVAGLIFGFAAGIDLTRRDLQAQAKKAGRPWDMAKGFDHSAPVGPITRGIPPAAGAIALTVNGEVRQEGDLSQMIWKVEEIVATLSTFIELRGGDLIFTGTPAGVGPVVPGETLWAIAAGAEPLEIRVGG